MITANIRLSVFAAAAAAVLPVAAIAQSTSGQDLTPDGRGAYVSVAGAVNGFEVRSGEIALTKARRPEVRQLAQTIVDAHRQGMERLIAAARERGIDASEPGLLPFQWSRLRRLERASGSRFDRVYVEQQIEAHEIAVELHRNFAENGDDPTLRAYAEAAAPVEQQHLDQARGLQ